MKDSIKEGRGEGKAARVIVADPTPKKSLSSNG